MEKLIRALAIAAAFAALPGQAADGIAFITNLKGEVSVDGAPRPLLMSELAKGQKVVVGKDGLVSVMFIQSGKEYALRGPGDYTLGERDITSGSGMPPAARETPWRASGEVLVKVARTSSASIRMRSIAPPRAATKPVLEYPADGSVASLQPVFRWHGADPNAAVEVGVWLVGQDGQPFPSAKVKGDTHRFSARLKPDTEYAWTVSAGGRELGSAKFRTLPAAAIAEAERRRPTERAEFSDRLMYALLLHELGAEQDAREAWGRLARERADLPELASLAR